MNVVIKICSIIGTCISVLIAYRVVFILVGLFKTRKFAPAKEKHMFGLCIAARNEEKVIENLLESISKQDYPMDKMRVFVCANNCTDQTARKVRDFALDHVEMNITVYERNNPDERTKGYALKYMFEEIEKDFGRSAFDGYFIFDADNVLNPDYVSKMNDAFDSGCKIVTSYRHSKNMFQNWISFQYAIHWMRTCFSENRGKSYLNQACRVQGTGFLFASELVKDGWTHVGLTEDRLFCSDALVKGYRISYCEAAKFYDEQPYKLKISLRQRLRWAKGHLDSFKTIGPQLAKNTLKFNKDTTVCYDMFWINFPYAVESGIRKIIIFAMQVGIFFTTYNTLSGGGGAYIQGILLAWLVGKIGFWLGGMFTAAFVMIFYRKQIGKAPFWKSVVGIFLFPLFDIIGHWCSYIAVFAKVEWKPIPHDRVMDIGELVANQEEKK